MRCAVLVVVVAIGVRGQDRAWIQEICERVRTVDSSVIKDIENLATIDPEDFLNNMRDYVQAIKNFLTCIAEDKAAVTELAQDILEEEGPKFYYIYDPEYIQNITNWGETEMDDCNQLYKQAIEAWIDIDKAIGVNKGNDKEASGNIPEDRQLSGNIGSPEKEKSEEKWVEHKFLDN